jgi:capsule polysaccharide export protein KpsE/RkpR
MANNEVERISGLKQEVSNSYTEVQHARDEEEVDRERIQKLHAEINSLKRQQQQHTELEEDKVLKQLKDRYEEL